MLNAYSYYLPSLNLEELTILRSQMHPDNMFSVKDPSMQSMDNILALKVTLNKFSQILSVSTLANTEKFLEDHYILI